MLESWGVIGTLEEIIINAIIFILILFCGFIIGRFVKKRLMKFAEKTKTKADDIFVEKAFPWLNWLFLLVAGRIAIGFALNFKTLPSYVDSIFYTFLTVLILFFSVHLIRFLIGVLNRVIAKEKGITVKNPLLPLFNSITRVAIYVVGFLVILGIWGINIGPFLGGLGIAGLAISFAVKDSLQNVFGGVSLILDNTMKVGDRIKLDDGTSGIVHDMTLRSSKIRTWDNEIIVIPNGILANSRIQNIEAPDPKVRAVIPFSVAYGSDIKKVKDLVFKTIKKVENCLDEPEPSVTFDEMADFSLNFSAKFWVARPNLRYAASLQAREMIYNVLNKNGISIPFPTHTIYVENADARKKEKNAAKESAKSSKKGKSKKTKK